ncbi:hypothetical protein B7463_g4188, partial [Scytalidium lignicola]
MACLDGPLLAQIAQELTEDQVHDAREQIGPCNEAGHAITGFAYPFDNPVFYIKFGNRSSESMTAEALTHQFVFEAFEQMPPENRKGIRVPQIFRILNTHQGTYIIMEYIQGMTLGQLYKSTESFEVVSKPYYEQIARGVKLLLSISVPADAEPGPYGGGIIKHPFFKDFEAPTRYDSIDTLEKHINKLATWFQKSNPTVTLERQLHLVYSDLFEGNFIFTNTGDLYIIDFDLASFLPLSFQDFALRFPSVMSCTVASRIQGEFKDLPQENFIVMKRVSGLMCQSSRKLGLPV